jgi:hypothetical protein
MIIAKVEKNPLKQVAHIEDAIAAAFDHFNFGLVQSKVTVKDSRC